MRGFPKRTEQVSLALPRETNANLQRNPDWHRGRGVYFKVTHLANSFVHQTLLPETGANDVSS